MVGWKKIPWFGNYEVSSQGIVRSCFRGELKVLKPTIRPDGFVAYRLRADGEYHYQYAHRLVAEVFLVGKKLGKNYVVYHKNDNKKDNHPNNLGIKDRNPILPGVTISAGGKYVAKCNRKHIGVFDTPEEAHEAYKKAKKN